MGGDNGQVGGGRHDTGDGVRRTAGVQEEGSSNTVLPTTQRRVVDMEGGVREPHAPSAPTSTPCPLLLPHTPLSTFTTLHSYLRTTGVLSLHLNGV